MRHGRIFVGMLLPAAGLVAWVCFNSVARGTLRPTAKPDSGEYPLYGRAFAQYWHDGKAELAAYELTYPRYRAARKGTAVTIFVTEHFTDAQRVKAEKRHDDVFPVLKLNLVQDFQTGIYDYNLMTSAFVATSEVHGRPAGSPVKVSFSAQEWCGHVYHQALFDADRVRATLHSYFDGESDQQYQLEYPANAVAEDALLIWARGLAGPTLKPGQTRRLPILRSLAYSRLNHVPLRWDQVTLSRSGGVPPITVPAGTFQVARYTARIEPSSDPATARSWSFYVEQDRPHRIVKWQRSDGIEAVLLGSKRLAYWKLNGPGRESLLNEIGLTTRPARRP